MPRPLKEQVVVVTGASSGIGRATALKLASAGASVVLAARNQMALELVAGEIRESGGQAAVVVTDVAEWEQVKNLAEQAISLFGRVDTWVNNAGIGVIASVEDTTLEEMNRLVQVNLLGMMYGVKAILPAMKRQGCGTIINVSSILGIHPIPLQVTYAATKHGVKGFTDGLRMELRHSYRDIHAVAIYPAGINTPFFNHVHSALGVKPASVPPFYSAHQVADAIVYAAEHPQREFYVGGVAFGYALFARLTPALLDRLMLVGGFIFRAQKSKQPDDLNDNVFNHPNELGRIEGDFGHLTKPSLYVPLFETRPNWQRRLWVLAGVVLAGLSIRRTLS